MAKKRKTKQAPEKKVVENVQPSKVFHPPEDLGYRSLFIKLAIVSAVVFAAGYLITLFATEFVIHYDRIAISGRVWQDEHGRDHIAPSNRYLFEYRIIEENSVQPKESKFSRAGSMGTALYIYSVINAMNLMLEFQFSNLRALVFVSFFTILLGSTIFLWKCLPLRLRTSTYIVGFSVVIAIFHALILNFFLIAAYLGSEYFRDFYQMPHHYIGQISGLILPTLVIIILTNMIYGAISGGILSIAYPIFSTVSYAIQESSPSQKSES